MNISVLIEEERLLAELLELPEVSGIYLSADRTEPERLKTLTERIHRVGKKCYYAFPFVFRGESLAYFEPRVSLLAESGCDGWLIRSLDEAGFVQEHHLPGERIFDAGMYVWNRLAAEQMRLLGADVLTVPYELNAGELSALQEPGMELIIYGRIPVMISAQCMQKTALHHCRKEEGGQALLYPLKDRKGAEFLAENRCRFCYNVIYNSVPSGFWIREESSRSGFVCSFLRRRRESPRASSVCFAGKRRSRRERSPEGILHGESNKR